MKTSQNALILNSTIRPCQKGRSEIAARRFEQIYDETKKQDIGNFHPFLWDCPIPQV